MRGTWRFTISISKRPDLKKILTPIFITLVTGTILSQQPDSGIIGIHQLQNDFFSRIKSSGYNFDPSGEQYPSDLIINPEKDITKRVLGWHPYWSSATGYQYYDYYTLSHIAYFSYEVDTATGGYTTIHEWNTTPLISYAHQQGTKVLLTVTNFGASRNTELLTDTVKQIFLINTLISLLKSRNGDGVNFDLESVSSTQRTNLVNFISRAASMIKSAVPEAEISMATPAVDWSNSWNLWALSRLCDYLIVMGYDYYWSGSSTAGPVAPLTGEPYNVTKTLDTYLNAGVAPDKLMLGVPWYGYDWPVVSSAKKAAATGKATARVYTAADQLADKYGKVFDQTSGVPWLSYNSSSQWRQLWYDDAQSLGLKYNIVNSKKLGGIGIWALGYEGGRSEIWGKIYTSFAPYDTTVNRILNIYPNPVSESATIIYMVVKRCDVQLGLFDSFGRKILVITNKEVEAGTYENILDVSQLSPGVYLCILKAGGTTDSKKIVVMNK